MEDRDDLLREARGFPKRIRWRGNLGRVGLREDAKKGWRNGRRFTGGAMIITAGEMPPLPPPLSEAPPAPARNGLSSAPSRRIETAASTPALPRRVTASCWASSSPSSSWPRHWARNQDEGSVWSSRVTPPTVGQGERSASPAVSGRSRANCFQPTDESREEGHPVAATHSPLRSVVMGVAGRRRPLHPHVSAWSGRPLVLPNIRHSMPISGRHQSQQQQTQELANSLSCAVRVPAERRERADAGLDGRNRFQKYACRSWLWRCRIIY